MAVSLKKGGRVNLSKDFGLESAMLGLGWDTNRYQGSDDFDLDLVIFMCGADKKCHDEKNFVYYHNLTDPSGAVIHSGDNRTGAGDGDDESAKIDFSKMPANVQHIVVAVTIYDAKSRNQNFGLVDNAYIRIVDEKSGEEKIRYDLTEDYSTQTSLVFVEIYNKNGEWRMNAVGEGYEKELEDLCVEYGLEVAD